MVTGVVPHPIPSTVTLAPSGVDVITSDVTTGGVGRDGVRTPDVPVTGSGSTIAEVVTDAGASAVGSMATATARSTIGPAGGGASVLIGAGRARVETRASDGLGLNQMLTSRTIRTTHATGNAK